MILLVLFKLLHLLNALWVSERQHEVIVVDFVLEPLDHASILKFLIDAPLRRKAVAESLFLGADCMVVIDNFGLLVDMLLRHLPHDDILRFFTLSATPQLLS